jgi:hypothetical protein
VHINKIAAAAVNLAKNGAAPVLPKTVWLEPPKAAPMPAPLPCWRSTIKMRARQTIICTMITAVAITLII